MKQFVRLFSKDIHNDDLAEAMRYVFDYNCVLHTYHYEDEESEHRLVSFNTSHFISFGSFLFSHKKPFILKCGLVVNG